jgi:bleomycin hydrolase
MKYIHNLILLVFFIALSVSIKAQYVFDNTASIFCQHVQSQDKTGTCWSYATSSFIESELHRIHGIDIDLAEMYAVRYIYKDKAQSYLLRQGNTSFGQGALAHDLLRAIEHGGLIPEESYPGKEGKIHNHGELEAGIKSYLDGILKKRPLSNNWRKVIESMLDAYLGAVPETFSWKGKNYTPTSLLKTYPIPFDQYVGLSSFSHIPFHSEFVLDVPDNFSNGQFYNVPMQTLFDATVQALTNGYSVAWDGDVSEKGFSAKDGLAIFPEDENRKDLFDNPGEEAQTSQELRQKYYEDLTTTDDHLMHIVGMAKDQHGQLYFVIKNSWGEIGPYKGRLYMSEAYFKMKTISVHMHKEGLPSGIIKM